MTAGAGIDGWIEFQNFGGAEESDLRPGPAHPVPSNFVINFGDRLRANFHVVMEDQPVRHGGREQRHAMPTAPHIGGTLDGYFDFNLARGRAAQPFP